MTDSTDTTDDTTNSYEDVPAVSCDGDDNTQNQPYGATVVSAAYAAIASACQNIEQAMGPLENPSTKDGLQAILTALQEQLTALEGLYSSNYPEQPTLKSDDDDDGDGGGDDKAMKAFLAMGPVASLRVLGLGARLKGMIGARNLTSGQRRTLTSVTQQMATLVSEAKSLRSQVDETKIITLQKSIQELTGLVGNLTK